MRHHQYAVELAHARGRLWTLFQRYDLWPEFAPGVLGVAIVHPGDAQGNGLLRRVEYPLPFGRRGESFELVTNVRPAEGYDYLMIRSGLSGSVRLTSPGPNRTQLCFTEPFHMTTPVLRWFEASIYRYINKKNEESMRGAAHWLDQHPDFHPELIEPA